MKPSGQKLRELRTAAGLTQADLARRLGLSKGRVSQMETSGEGLGRLDRLDELAEALGVPVSVLMEQPSEEAGRREPSQSTFPVPRSPLGLTPLQNATVDALVKACSRGLISDAKLLALLNELHAQLESNQGS